VKGKRGGPCQKEAGDRGEKKKWGKEHYPGGKGFRGEKEFEIQEHEWGNGWQKGDPAEVGKSKKKTGQVIEAPKTKG